MSEQNRLAAAREAAAREDRDRGNQSRCRTRECDQRGLYVSQSPLHPETPHAGEGAYALRRPTSSAPQSRPVPACGVRLLVVEDDPDQQELIVETLQEHFGAGCTDAVFTCGDALQKPLNKYDLILTDYNLPDGNGVDLLGKIKACTNAPVMLLTGENDTRTAKEAMRRGATDYVVKAGEYLLTMPLIVEKNLAAARMASERELAERQAQQAMQDRTTRLETELKQAEQLANTDAMTGCYNRRAFDRVFAQMFAEATRTDAELCCIMLDLDKFKQVNDTFGHDVGDDLVRAAARAIRENLRAMDVPCRYGGDEFIILLPKAGADEAQGVAARIRNAYATASNGLVGEAKTMSVGIAGLKTTHPAPTSTQELWVAADKALIRAKESGRDQICAAA